MIELDVINGKNPIKAVKLYLPEEPEYLWQKLSAIGVEKNNYEITRVRCYPGNLERFIKKHTSVHMLNYLALRLKRLPAVMLYEVEAFLETTPPKAFAELFRLLDGWEKPEHLQEAAVYLPASIQMIRHETMEEEGCWQKRSLSVQEAAGYLEGWNEEIGRQRLDEEGLRGLSCYLVDENLKKLIFSMDAALVIWEEALYLKFSCQLKQALTAAEEEALRKECLDLCRRKWKQPFFCGKQPEMKKRMSLAVSDAGSQFIYAKAPEETGKPALFQKEAGLLVDVYPKEDEGEDRDVLFMLPATYWSVRDLLEKMGAKEETELLVYFVDCPRMPVFTDWLWSQNEGGNLLGAISQWNQLALLLERLDVFAQKRLEALIDAMGESQVESLDDLIKLLLWVKDGVLLEGVLDDGALGQYCLENGYLKDKAWFLEQLEGYLDYSAIGMEWRASDGGVYTQSGYLTGMPKTEEVILPVWSLPEEEASIRIGLKFSKDRERVVFFPGKQEISEAKWQRMLAEAVYAEIDCIAQALIPAIYEGLKRLDLLQDIGKRLKELEEAGELTKFQALLELWEVTDIEGALKESCRLDDYQYYGQCRSAHSLGLMLFQLQYGLELTEEEKESMDFSRYGKRMAARVGAIETSYGYLLPEGV